MPISRYRFDRRSPRVYRPLPVTVRNAPSDRAECSAGTILDISDHGLRVATQSPLHPGQTVQVMLKHAGLCFRCCRVVWTRPKQFPQFSQAGLEVLR